MSKFDIINKSARLAGYTARNVAQWKYIGSVPHRHRNKVAKAAEGIGEMLSDDDMGGH